MSRLAKTLSIGIGSLGACAIVVLAAVPARAGDARAEVKATLDAQARAIVSGNVEAFVHTIGLDSFTMLPGGMGETPVQAAMAARRTWHDPAAPATAAKYGKAVIGVDGNVAWVTAELAVTMKSKVTTYRVSELLTKRPSGWAARAMMVSRAVPKFTGKIDDDATLPGAAPAPEKVAMADWITELGGMSAHLRAGKDVVVLGSAAGQRGEGAAAAKAMLAAWKKHTFIPQDLRGGSDDTSYAYVFGVIRDADGGVPSWVLLEGVRHGDGWDVVGVHVSQDPPVARLAEDD